MNTTAPAPAAGSDDSFYRAHYIDCPARLKAAMDRHLGRSPGCIVDFGCGRGIKTLALAAAYPEAEVIGVDITRAFGHANAFAAKYLEGRIPGNLRYVQIAPGGSLAAVAAPDVIYSWSVLEHVDRVILPSVLADMAAALTPGGIVVSQIAPLYFSPFGSHLRAFVDEPWAHLTLPHHVLRARVLEAGGSARGPDSGAWMFDRYEELNRVTAPELFGYFRDAGLTARQEDLSRVTFQPPAHLGQAYDPEALRTNELFSVHAAGGGSEPRKGLLARLRG